MRVAISRYDRRYLKVRSMRDVGISSAQIGIEDSIVDLSEKMHIMLIHFKLLFLRPLP